MVDLIARRRAYQLAVKALVSDVAALRSTGHSDEAIARIVVERRNALKMAFREADDPAIVLLMEARNMAKYGNPIGPNADYLFRKYGDWKLVIAAACRPAPLVIE